MIKPRWLWHLIKHLPLLTRWSWRFSSNRDVKSSLCLTISAISSSFSSESGIFFKRKYGRKKTAVSVIGVLQGQQKKKKKKSLFWKLEPSLTSIFSFSWFNPSSILISSLCQKLKPSTSNPGVLSSHSWKNSPGFFLTCALAQGWAINFAKGSHEKLGLS